MPDAPVDVWWIGTARLLSITDLRRTTFQSWVRAKLVVPDPDGAYGEGAALEVAFLVALRDYFALDDLVTRWGRLRAGGEVARMINLARKHEEGGRFDVVVEPQHGGISVARDDIELADAVRHPEAPRPVIVIPLAAKVELVRSAFWSFATNADRPRSRVGRPARRQAALRSVSGGKSS